METIQSYVVAEEKHLLRCIFAMVCRHPEQEDKTSIEATVAELATGRGDKTACLLQVLPHQ